MPEHLKSVASSLALEDASRIIDAAIAARHAQGLLPLAVAVLDAGGNLVAFKREDGCGVLRFDIAVGISGDASDKDEYCAITAIHAAGFASEPAAPSPDWASAGL